MTTIKLRTQYQYFILSYFQCEYQHILTLGFNRSLQQISKKMRNQLFCVLIVALVLSCSHALDWQAVGELNKDNMTIIWNYINSKFIFASPPLTGQGALMSQVDNFAEYLNGLWAPAWNIVLVYNEHGDQNKDSVLYGYAYKKHWMWYNGIKTPKGHYFTVIIWKDYNCMGYKSFDPQGSSATPSDTTAINSVVNSYPSKYDDIWKAAKGISEGVETSLTGRAYSVVVSQASSAYFFGRCCVGAFVGRRALYTDATQGTWGSVLVMQMR